MDGSVSTPRWVFDPVSLLDRTARLRIAHHLPGRVRLKLAGGALAGESLADVRAFLGALAATPGIASAEVNPLAQSCLILYDTKVIDPATWVDLVAGTGSPLALALLHAVADRARALT